MLYQLEQLSFNMKKYLYHLLQVDTPIFIIKNISYDAK